MKNGGCRMHGGLSTGPRTPEGLERSRHARWSREGTSVRVANAPSTVVGSFEFPRAREKGEGVRL